MTFAQQTVFDRTNTTDIRQIEYVVDGDSSAMSEFASYVDLLNMGDHVPHIVGIKSPWTEHTWSLPMTKVRIRVRGLESHHHELARKYSVLAGHGGR